MKKILTAFAIILFTSYTANSTSLTGGVSEHGAGNVVVDAQTHAPIVDAQISLPQKGYRTKTDKKGAFTLNATINDETILSVQKEGYRPYSITIDKEIASHPMVLGIQKSELMDVVIDSEMLHLGDNTFSSDSANARDFKLQAIGPTYTKQFKMTTNTLNYTNYLVIGSIIGVDTEMARRMKQNTITNSYSSPPEVYFNGKKIAEIKLNGDNQKIKLPKSLIRPDDVNEITIQTGVNQFQKARVDYDDIELMNLSILSE